MGLQRPKSLKLVIFGINFPKRGIPPESIFLQKLSWGGSPRFAPSRQISSLWEYSPQNRQNWYFFGINLPKKGVPLKRFLQNLVWQRESQVCTFMPNFTVVAVKMWAYSPQTGKKMVIFGINIAPKGKFWGSTEKLEYRCTTTNLPACNYTVIVFKILLLHSVSVITNFVIPKRDKQTDKKYHTFSSTAGARPTIPTILGMVIEEFLFVFHYNYDHLEPFWISFQKFYTNYRSSQSIRRSEISPRSSTLWVGARTSQTDDRQTDIRRLKENVT